mmetsp:Transcript_19240/g.41709  ORF Transcript_19240/g.41709 Transcript_19240/m.41709 type:complete len:93 (+) Transcript_19240:596-874(+)
MEKVIDNMGMTKSCSFIPVTSNEQSILQEKYGKREEGTHDGRSGMVHIAMVGDKYHSWQADQYCCTALGLNLDAEGALKDALSGFLCYDNWW